MINKKDFSLPFATTEVLEELKQKDTISNEIKYGNGDFINLLDILGIAGPFKSINPWEIENEKKNRFIYAGGYSALIFGEKYPPLLNFLQNYLSHNNSIAFPQQSASMWRAALEANIIHILSSISPSHADSQIFFSNSGTEAIEAALKFSKADRPEAKYLINFKNGYHGKTYGALSITPNEEYQRLFRPLIPNVITIDFGDANLLESTIQRLGNKNIIAVILEPIQGEAGIIIPPKSFLPDVEILRKKYGILIIADEIQTGLGRAGYWFPSIEWGGLDPDIITLAKPLGGGLIPIGATIARKKIYKKMLGGIHSKRHSSTFGGGSLAMAVGLKSLEIIVTEKLVERAGELGAIGLEKLKEVQRQHPNALEDVRGIGMMMALQLHPTGMLNRVPSSEKIEELTGILGFIRLFNRGVYSNFSLNANHTIRLTPPLTIPNTLYDQIFERVVMAMKDCDQGMSLKEIMMLTKLTLSS